MANKFEKFSSTNNDYQVARDIQQKDALNEKLNWERKVKTSFSIQQKNIDRLDEMVNQLNAKSRSALLDTIIENAYRDFQE
ncbi:hypothetical protein [Ligilactobacillus salivarius]|uniref:Uncharacterized protein n=1 Tax=Ligilactobacillus salivarius TaxID=1624 RepID=A0A1V9U3M8_9LACO|nr:hypothetical protein [Ligilactobacillus salivarius]OQR19044.1 hypothetical protein B6U39_09045 [Ligilactobacillus salivarius]OQR21453.1 hypothetical protein B6U38_08885 [Ligilactobacillus salivarius]OQR24502.1 hypothetical protein B6U37_09055 [Ligilactobacillus salivarius]